MNNILFKNKQNEILSLSPLDIENGRDKGLVKLTDAEVEAFLNPPKTDEEFKLKYNDIIVKQEEARALINELGM